MMRTGCFPLGPAPKIQADRKRAEDTLKKFIGLLLKARNRLVANRYPSPSDLAPFVAILGKPESCIVCGTPLIDREPTDLDSWFRAAHCPVCHGVEALTFNGTA